MPPGRRRWHIDKSDTGRAPWHREFTIDNQYGGFWPFVLSLEQDGEFQTYKLAVTMGPTWWVSGINAINGGPVKIT